MDHQVVHDEGPDGAALPFGEDEDLAGHVAAVTDPQVSGGTVHASEEAQGLVQLDHFPLRLSGGYAASFEPHITSSISAEMSLHMAFWEHSVGR